MPLEIERKFLMMRVPFKAPDDTLDILQAYVDDESGKYRIRKTKPFLQPAHYDKTVKIFKSDGVYDETIEKIDSATFEALLLRSELNISKLRYIFHDEATGLKWEVDLFMHNSSYLIVAEVELPTENYDLKIPDFIEMCMLTEVTHLPQFTNVAIAKQMKKWPKE